MRPSRRLSESLGRYDARLIPGLGVCALALLAGVALFDDYSVRGDVFRGHHALAEVILRHLAGDGDAFETLHIYHDRFYGGAFEVLLLLAERALGLDDSRSVFLARHLLTHLFFLAAGFTGYLLARRLFRSRAVALFALALFLLHPRIYAHSFFNSTDVPFLGLFMVCLWLASRAFGVEERAAGSLGAFALCGGAAGLLASLRVMGFAFVAVVGAALVCDLWEERTRGKRRRTLAALVIFLASSAVTYYAFMPYLWADPFDRFVEMLTLLVQHPTRPFEIFQGEVVSAAALPPHYVPVWFALTTPPLALLLGAVGVASLVWRGMARRGDLLRNTPLRFELLLVACIALPLLAIAILQSVMYNNWRHTYFLWAPFALLAASGLRALIDAARHLPRHLPLTPRLAGLAIHGLAALGLAAVAVQMARLHPHQNLYFNALATAIRTDAIGTDAIRSDRTGSAPLHKRYLLFNHKSVVKTGYAHVLDERSNAIFNMPAYMEWGLPLSYGTVPRRLETFPRHERRRLAFDPNADPDFYILRQRAIAFPRSIDAPDTFFPPVLHERRFYGSAVLRVSTPDLSRVDTATAAAYRALYREATAVAPAIDGYFDVYRDESSVTLVREDCASAELHEWPKLTVHPSRTHPKGAAQPSGATGFRTYTQFLWGVRIGNACLWRAPLPDRPIAQIRVHGHGRLEPDAHLDEPRRRFKALVARSPAARSTFDVYLSDGTLAYVKTPCVAADVEAPFFLHIVPERASTDAVAQRRSFENLDFRWHQIDGEVFNGACLAERALPDYPVDHIATGQFVPSGTSLWRVEIPAAR